MSQHNHLHVDALEGAAFLVGRTVVTTSQYLFQPKTLKGEYEARLQATATRSSQLWTSHYTSLGLQDPHGNDQVHETQQPHPSYCIRVPTYDELFCLEHFNTDHYACTRRRR